MAESVSVLAVTIRDGINWRDADGGKAALAALEALLARLTTAEQERDQWEQECERRNVFNNEVAAACDAAEARVEALSEALRTIAEFYDNGERRIVVREIKAHARAALACPPQQRGE